MGCNSFARMGYTAKVSAAFGVILRPPCRCERHAPGKELPFVTPALACFAKRSAGASVLNGSTTQGAFRRAVSEASPRREFLSSGFAPGFSRRRASSEESHLATRPFAGLSPQHMHRIDPLRVTKPLLQDSKKRSLCPGAVYNVMRATRPFRLARHAIRTTHDVRKSDPSSTPDARFPPGMPASHPCRCRSSHRRSC